MRDDICTIPISEAFEEEGCPFCTMERRIAERLTEYISGPAMMEPDIREMTNKSGFCRKHFEGLLKMNNRLSLALTVQTYLTHGTGADISKKADQSKDQCFICENLESAFSHMISNFFARYAKEDGMREIFTEHGQICRPHFLRLHRECRKALPSKSRKLFEEKLSEIYLKSLDKVNKDIDGFAKSFDYRSAGKGASFSQSAVEDAIDFIVGKK